MALVPKILPQANQGTYLAYTVDAQASRAMILT